MGPSPIPPLLNDRIVREESVCEEQELEEPVFSGKMIAGGACRADRPRRSAIRVLGYGAQPHGNPLRLPFGRARGGWKREMSAARAGLAGSAILPFECRGMGAWPHVHPCPCPYNLYNLAYQNAKALV